MIKGPGIQDNAVKLDGRVDEPQESRPGRQVRERIPRDTSEHDVTP